MAFQTGTANWLQEAKIPDFFREMNIYYLVIIFVRILALPPFFFYTFLIILNFFSR